MEAVKDIKRPPFQYYGAKWILAPWIISFFPEHNNYIEICGGTASILMMKPRSPLETYNDINADIVNFFKVLREYPEQLIHKIWLTPWARAEFEECRYQSDDPIENARRFYVSASMAISRIPFDKHSGFRTASYFGQQRSRLSMMFAEEAISYLWDVCKRMEGVQIENRDARYVIERYDRSDALLYFDPPYVQTTRTAKNAYDFEVAETFHSEMAEMLRQAKGFVIVSGYMCEMYSALYEDFGWKRFDKESQINGGKKRFESVWLSPKTSEALCANNSLQPTQKGAEQNWLFN